MTGATDSTLCNVRDVGGLPVSGGGFVRSAVLYRSEAPVVGDVAPGLRPWPPRTVIDLRAPDERSRMQSPGPWPDGTVVRHAPLIAELDPIEIIRARSTCDSDYMAALFEQILEQRADTLVEIVSTIASAPAPVLVHCGAGKDRTSIAVTLALDAIGVETSALVADHLLSNDVLDVIEVRLSRALGETLPATPPPVDAVSLLRVMAVWRSHADGAAGWLVEHGLPAATSSMLRGRLIDAR